MDHGKAWGYLTFRGRGTPLSCGVWQRRGTECVGLGELQESRSLFVFFFFFLKFISNKKVFIFLVSNVGV